MKRKKSISSKASSARREREPVSWKFTIATVFCGLLIASGFFFAARQHFYSVTYGIENSRLRGQIEELRSKNRRLTLDRETALSPFEIQMAAGKIGLRSLTVRSLQAIGEEPVLENTNIEIASEMPPPPPPVRTFAKREEPAPPAREIKPKVVKTVKTYKSAEPVAPVEKPEDPKTATRSRIIDTVAKR